MDKRVGSEDKESYVELKDCLTLNTDGKIIAIDKLKRLTDSFIEDRGLQPANLMMPMEVSKKRQCLFFVGPCLLFA